MNNRQAKKAFKKQHGLEIVAVLEKIPKITDSIFRLINECIQELPKIVEKMSSEDIRRLLEEKTDADD